MLQFIKVGKYLSLLEFCTCTNTYQKYRDRIDPLPKNPDTIAAIKSLNQFILDPIINYFGREKFILTYGFCSPDLKHFLAKKDIDSWVKNGRIDPSRDQHMSHEINRRGNPYCKRLGASCDFAIAYVSSDKIVDWILTEQLPFDSLYYYGCDRPIHISYGPQHKRDIWTFIKTGQPTKKGIENWLELAKKIDN
jgi:hypothetical protein